MAKKQTTDTMAQAQDIQIKKYADGHTGAPTTVDADLHKAFNLRHQAAALKQKAKELEDEAYEILGPAYLVHGMSTLYLPGVGRTEIFQGQQSRLDAGKFCELLVMEYGVPADSVQKAKAAATQQTVNKKLTVKFKADKPK